MRIDDRVEKFGEAWKNKDLINSTAREASNSRSRGKYRVGIQKDGREIIEKAYNEWNAQCSSGFEQETC